jgi:hypothetical protein
MHLQMSKMLWSVPTVPLSQYIVVRVLSVKSGTISILQEVYKLANLFPRPQVRWIMQPLCRSKVLTNPRWPIFQLPQARHSLSTQALGTRANQDHYTWVGAYENGRALFRKRKPDGIHPQPKTRLHHQLRHLVRVWNVCYFPGTEGIRLVFSLLLFCGDVVLILY